MKVILVFFNVVGFIFGLMRLVYLGVVCSFLLDTSTALGTGPKRTKNPESDRDKTRKRFSKIRVLERLKHANSFRGKIDASYVLLVLVFLYHLDLMTLKQVVFWSSFFVANFIENTFEWSRGFSS